MPYIKPDLRPRLDYVIHQLEAPRSLTVGEMNYLITRLLLAWLPGIDTSYTSYNAVLGLLEAVKLEFYRRRLAPYEDQKMGHNGDAYYV